MPRAGYFPILDVLRWVASSAVVLAHSVVFFPSSIGLVHFGGAIRNAGYYAVLFFYTLSGFLITWLLLAEKEKTGDIALAAFYKRRALRIWPLYYLIVLLSFFVFPYLLPLADSDNHQGWWSALSLYLFFLPNVAALKGFYLATCFQTYTIGYEEQFYLIWPLLLRRTGRLPLLLAGLFVLLLLLELWHLRIISHGLPLADPWVRMLRAVLSFINYWEFPAFIVGAAGAWLYLKRRRTLKWLIGSRVMTAVILSVIAALVCFGKPHAFGYVNLVSIVFTLLILNLIEFPVNGLAGVLARGGRISYGIYIYHPVVLLSLSLLMEKTGLGIRGTPLLSYLIYTGVAYSLVLLLSSISYRYYEKFFLRKKSASISS